MPRMVRMEAKADFQKRGQALVAGEVFEVDQLSGFLLDKSGVAKFVRQITPLHMPVVVAAPIPAPRPDPFASVKLEPVPEPEPVVPPVEEREHAETHQAEETEPAQAGADDTPQIKRRYRRRDLNADEA